MIIFINNKFKKIMMLMLMVLVQNFYQIVLQL